MCDCGDVLHLGAEAAEALLRDVYRVELEKAKLDPLKARDFAVIVERLAKALRGVTKAAEDRAIADALDVMDVDWRQVRSSKVNEIVGEAKRTMGRIPDEVMPRVTEVLDQRALPLVMDTKTSTIRKFHLDIESSLTMTDENIATFARDSSALFVRDAYGVRAERFSQRARTVVSEGLALGLGREEIASDLARAAADGGPARSTTYWRGISTVFANRARTHTEVMALEEAELESFLFVAVMDQKTSMTCTFMNGQTFPVPAAAEHVRKVVSMKNPEDIVRHAPFVNEGTDEDGNPILYFKRGGERHVVADILPGGGFKARMDRGQIQAAGIAIPPLHFPVCRSTIVAV